MARWLGIHVCFLKKKNLSKSLVNDTFCDVQPSGDRCPRSRTYVHVFSNTEPYPCSTSPPPTTARAGAVPKKRVMRLCPSFTSPPGEAALALAFDFDDVEPGSFSLRPLFVPSFPFTVIAAPCCSPSTPATRLRKSCLPSSRSS